MTIPIRVIAATETHNIQLHQYHDVDQGRIRYQKVCELDGKVLEPEEIGRGYEIARDTVVPVTDEELDNLPLPTARTIEIVAFLPAERIDPIRMADGYYLQAGAPAAEKPYVLLRRALERSSRVAIAQYAWHGRERLGMLRVIDDAIALHSLKWDDEVREPTALAPAPVAVDDEEVDAAVELMETLGRDDISGYTDQYTEAMAALIEAKQEGVEPPRAPREEQPAQVVDLMDALRSSVTKARTARGEGEQATVHEMPGRRKKTTAADTEKTTTTGARKTTPKKTTAKKSTAKKSTARRPRRSA
ncbi:non-homologous end joining protein Ku [Streptomyces sulfonofaciens]|uniref:Non-homologous end joining protein Ku n=1 Tax=Streptomyces sulfonofaciens TaxID=68272 RepID=A0A919L772_9ACTN|nr:non-homologous end joining protein Ku [Streptomyces sulfonofaciens]